MPRLNKEGNYVISAAEVGTYTVCPESWRLRVLEGLDNKNKSESVELGNRMHDDWMLLHKEVLFFRKGIKITLLLAANAIALTVFLIT